MFKKRGSLVKKIVSALIIPIMAFSTIIFSNPASVSAASINPDVEGPCPVHGIHALVSSGPALCYNINNQSQLLYSGGVYICRYCGDVFFCEGYPNLGGSIGHYYDEVQYYNMYGGVYSVFVNPSGIMYTSSSSLPGFTFYSA